MKQNKSTIITICYIVLMVIFIVMVNSGTNHTGKQKHGAKDQVSDPTAYKEAVEPNSQTAKLAYLNQVLDTIATTDNRPASKSGEEEGENPFASKLSPDVAIAKLQQGNIRYAKGESTHPNLDAERRLLAATENQADHAFATVLACSDSRVPVEALFDAGVMDIFTVRVAGNVCDVDEIGSIEYGLAHVRTPTVVVLGHTKCDHIGMAVKKAMKLNPDVKGEDIIPIATEENVWSTIEELFKKSPITRDYVSKGYAAVVGAIYDIGTGNVTWLSEDKTFEILAKVEASSDRAVIEADAVKENPKTTEKCPKAIENNAVKQCTKVIEKSTVTPKPCKKGNMN